MKLRVPNPETGLTNVSYSAAAASPFHRLRNSTFNGWSTQCREEEWHIMNVHNGSWYQWTDVDMPL
jgi:hypothetical protein